jgi:hypothetical protein
MNVDIHQHVWTGPLLDALTTRRCLPFVQRTDGLRTRRPSRTSSHRRRVGSGAALHAPTGDLAVVALSADWTEAAPMLPPVSSPPTSTGFSPGEGFAAWTGSVSTPIRRRVAVLARLRRRVGPACALGPARRAGPHGTALERVSPCGPAPVHPGGVADGA